MYMCYQRNNAGLYVMCRYVLHLQIAQHVVIVLNLLSLAAVVMLGSIFSCSIVDVWNSLSDIVAVWPFAFFTLNH